MRRFMAGCAPTAAAAAVATSLSKRAARKRGAAHPRDTSDTPAVSQEQPSHSTFDLSGLRAAGTMAAAPSSTSLDTIRAEIHAMRREAQLRVEEEELRKRRAAAAESASVAAQVQRSRELRRSCAPGEHEDAQSSVLLAAYRRQHKPNDTYYYGSDIAEGLAAADREAKRAFLSDVDEVLRGKNDTVGRQYVKMLFPHVAEPHARSKALETLLEETTAEYAKQLAALEMDATDAEEEPVVARLVWMSTLEALGEERIRQLWHFGILDSEVLEDLLESAPHDDRPAAEEEPLSDTEDTATPLPMLQERIATLRRIGAAQELTSTICSTALGGSPSIDLAPVLLKARARAFDDITQKELTQLEQFEEAVDPLVTRTLDQSPCAPLLAQSGLTNARLERALRPSNKLLDAVAQRDAALRASLDGLERIKRRTLLDPAFQSAVELAHRWESEAVDTLVRGTASTGAGAEKRLPRGGATTRGRRTRGASMAAGRGLTAQSAHAADIPYFYNSIRSVVPPRGAFNLPAPAPSAEEKAALRGARRRMRGRTRFAR